MRLHHRAIDIELELGVHVRAIAILMIGELKMLRCAATVCVFALQFETIWPDDREVIMMQKQWGLVALSSSARARVGRRGRSEVSASTCADC